jgi:hypothetical protein
MSILQVVQINKKDQKIVFDTGVVIDISVERIFEVGMYIRGRKIGRIKFSALSSLNNLEIKPHYNLDELAVEPEVVEYSGDLCKAAVDLFKVYTNGRIRIAHDLTVTELAPDTVLN